MILSVPNWAVSATSCAVLLALGCVAPPTPRGTAVRHGSVEGRSADPEARRGLARLERLAAERAEAGGASGSRLGPSDLVQITVFGLDEMNRTVRVTESGDIPLPLIGSVPAAGKTENDLARDIANRLSGEYLQNPQVDVLVSEYRSQMVAVTGAVAKPGLYPLTTERATILDLLSEAGGLSSDAGAYVDFMPGESQAASTVMRQVSGGKRLQSSSEPKGIPIEVSELMRGANRTLLDFPVLPGDVLFVPEGGSFSIEGWVERPGTYSLSRGTTVLGAIAAGGGESFAASLSGVEVLRNTPGEKYSRGLQVVDVSGVRAGRGGDLALRAGDVVHVPVNPVLLPAWIFVNGLKQLVRIGANIVLF